MVESGVGQPSGDQLAHWHQCTLTYFFITLQFASVSSASYIDVLHFYGSWNTQILNCIKPMGKVLCTSPHPEISNQIHPFHSFTLKAPRWDGIFLYFQHPQIYQSKTAAKRSLAMIIATVSTLQGFIAPSLMVLLSKSGKNNRPMMRKDMISS